MTEHYAKKLSRKHWYDLNAIRGLIKDGGTLNANVLMEKLGWCRTKAVEVLNVAEMLGLLKESR